MPLEQGQIQVYTGNGKGKTTAALGLALRACGRGLRVLMIQFMKGGGPYGEHAAAEKLAPLLTVVTSGRPGWVKRPVPDPEDVNMARAAFAKACEAVTGGGYDMVILDEINGAVSFNLIPVADLLALMQRKPATVELVLTGRDAPEEIIAAANLVTEMKDVKHYYRAGVPAREGIEK